MPQLLLFPDPRPLVERLGREFFRRLPERPGVYLMYGAAEVVLYVGKAKRLRHRLSSYRVANPERMARRTLRLLRMVERITWEECASESAALQREAELLLALKPRFNRAGVWRGPDRYLGWRTTPAGLELAVAESPQEGWAWVGPFGAQAVHLQRALVRLLWSQLHPEQGLAGMPAGWWEGRHGLRLLLKHSARERASEHALALVRLATGDRAWLSGLAPVRASYETEVREADLETVTRFLVGRGLVIEATGAAAAMAHVPAAGEGLCCPSHESIGQE